MIPKRGVRDLIFLVKHLKLLDLNVEYCVYILIIVVNATKREIYSVPTNHRYGWDYYYSVAILPVVALSKIYDFHKPNNNRLGKSYVLR